MPATQVTPLLRRLLSDEARQMVSTVLGFQAIAATGMMDIRHLSLSARLQNFRAQVRLELNRLGTSSIPVVLTVSGEDFCYRYHMAGTNADLCILNQRGTSTKWIAHGNGQQEQLQDYLAKIDTHGYEYMKITTFVELVDCLDLVEVFRASQHAVSVGTCEDSSFDTSLPACHSKSSRPAVIERHMSIPTLSSSSQNGSSSDTFWFETDARTGQPLRVTQERRRRRRLEDEDEEEELECGDGPEEEEDVSMMTTKVNLMVEDYIRYEEKLMPPAHIPSDMEMMINITMSYFTNDWSPEAQRYILNIFDELDYDGDGYISGADVSARLESTGQSKKSAQRTAMEMVRLLSNQDDPSEEFTFHQFCGFFMAILADGQRLSDPSNQVQMIKAFRQLFCGEIYLSV